MKPVVSSLVALAIAIAPLSYAYAKPAHKPAHAKVVKDHKAGQTAEENKSEEEKAENTGAPASAAEDKKTPIVHVKATTSSKKIINPGRSVLKPVALHHAHNADVSGPGHHEPKVDQKGALVPVSMTTKNAHGKTAHVKPMAKPELPKLPDPKAGKPSKGGGAEKAAHKPAAEKKSESSANDDGQPARDEDDADLVARIRGNGLEDIALTEKAAKAAKKAPPPPCAKDPVEVVRGPEMDRFELTKCDGTPAPTAIDHFSIMIRPGGVARPVAPLSELSKKTGAEVAHGIRRVDPRLLDRVQALTDHFGKPGAPARLFVISGYRPQSVGSMHSTGRAVDFRLEGVKNEEIVAFCKTLDDTGCGYYPNSSFVHVDVRDGGAGHVSWIDASGPGETPRYVSAWPPPPKALEHTSLMSKSTQELINEGESLLRARRPLDADAPPDVVDETP